jgi:dTDP-4-dehydrorhamnose reductase
VHPVALIGANGQLGTDLRRHSPPGREVISTTREQLDVRDHDRVNEFVQDLRPDVIVNTSAFLNVDRCEDEADEAYAVNDEAVRNLAAAADRAGSCLVHMSTDYVFDGAQREPYGEDAPTNPLNVYGRSKLAGEQHVRELCRRHVVVRSSGLYGVAGSSGKGGNFVRTMLRLGHERGEVAVVTDQVLGPTNTADLAQTMWRIIEGGAQGLYHVTSSGSCSWFDFARAIFELSRMQVTVRPIDSATLAARAARPPYSVLDNSKLERDGFGRMRSWREALASHLEALGSLT